MKPNPGKYKPKDLVGHQYAFFKVMSPTTKKAPNGTAIWLCKCRCGTLKELSSKALWARQPKSCGCVERVKRPRDNDPFTGFDLIFH